MAHGLRVGTYSSPHINRINDRICINGEPIDDTEFGLQIGAIADLEILSAIRPSFFEIMTAAMFRWFADEAVDVAVVEVGMLGRWDATNVIDSDVAVITNIALDHMEYAGPTVEHIAKEKAGIIKPGVPVVISQTQDEVKNVFLSYAKQAGAAIVFADQQMHPDYPCDLQGSYQKKNIQGVLSVLKQLAKAWGITEEHVRAGLSQVQALTGFQGRWQVLSTHPTCIADTAHNVDGLTLTLQQLQATPYRRLHLVLGFVKDKDLSAVLPLFPKTAHYYFCAPQMMRALPAASLQVMAQLHGLHGSAYSSVNQAFEAAKTQADTEDLIYVGGSTFVVAEVV